jgi:hypothetical protein
VQPYFFFTSNFWSPILYLLLVTFISPDLCSKSAIGSYSPEKTVAGADEALDADSSSEGSEDSESEEEDDAEPVEATAAKHFEQIISIVNHNAQKRQDKAVLRQQAARIMQAQANTVPTAAAAVAASANDHLNDFGESDARTYDAELHSTAADSSAEAASSSSTSHSTSTGPAGIRELVVAHIMSVLNTGTYEEVSSVTAHSNTVLPFKQRLYAPPSVTVASSLAAKQLTLSFFLHSQRSPHHRSCPCTA